MSLSQHTLTNIGRVYLSRAQLGEELRFRRMVVGEGVMYNIPTGLYPLTQLINYKMDVPINSADYIDDATIRVVGTLSSRSIPVGGGFRLNEIGIMAEVGTQPEMLYSTANNASEFGDQIPDGDPEQAPVIQTIEIYLKVDRVTGPIIIEVTPGGTVEAINRGPESVGPGPYIERVGDTLHFKRFVEGPGIALGRDQDYITVGVKTLEQDLDLYVPLNHPDGAGRLVFPDLHAALAYLRPIVIPPDRMARIRIAEGQFTYTRTVVVDHHQSDRIQILGQPPPREYQITRLTDGPANNRQNVTLTVNTNAGLNANNVGEQLYIYPSNPRGGAWQALYCQGLALVRGTTGATTINASITYASGGLAGNYQMRAIKLGTVLRFTGNIDGIRIKGNGINRIQHLALFGGGTANNAVVQAGLDIQNDGGDYSVIEFVGADRWWGRDAYGIASGCRTILRHCSANGCIHGIVAHDGANVGVEDCAAITNDWHGFRCYDSSLYITNCFSIENGGAGLHVDGFSLINMGRFIAWENGWAGAGGYGGMNLGYHVAAHNGEYLELSDNYGQFDLFQGPLSALGPTWIHASWSIPRPQYPPNILSRVGSWYGR